MEGSRSILELAVCHTGDTQVSPDEIQENYSMSSVEQSIDVNVNVTTAYKQWAQFESFPRWMEGVASVDQIDDSHLHWVAKVKDEVAEVENETREWDAQITEQIRAGGGTGASLGRASAERLMRSPTRGTSRLCRSAIRRAASPSRSTGSRRLRSSQMKATCSVW